MGGKKHKRGFRSTFTLMLIMYFAGFATAIYFLAPSRTVAQSMDKIKASVDRADAERGDASQEITLNMKSKLQKCISLAEDTSARAGKFIKGVFVKNPEPVPAE